VYRWDNLELILFSLIFQLLSIITLYNQVTELVVVTCFVIVCLNRNQNVYVDQTQRHVSSIISSVHIDILKKLNFSKKVESNFFKYYFLVL